MDGLHFEIMQNNQLNVETNKKKNTNIM